MSELATAAEYTRIPKAQLIEKLRHLEREVERLAQTTAVETPGSRVSNDSEQRFRDFAEIASDWFWETDEHLRFIYFSGRHDDVGLEIKKTMGKTRPEVTLEDTTKEKWKYHQADLAARSPFKDFRYESRARDGRAIHLSVSGKPIFDAAGKFEGYRGTGTDITALVEVENELTAAKELAAGAQERFMAAIESVSDGFALFDSEDRMVFCNNRFKELNPDLAPKIVPGILFEALLRDNIATNRILDALGDEEAFIRRRMEQHRNPSGTMVQQRQDGRWLELREERIPEGSTFLVNTDITERKRAEDLVRESEARLTWATEMAKIGYWVWDEVEDKALYCSDELAKMYGVASGAELTALSQSAAAELDWVHPDDRERVEQVIRTAYETRSGFNIEHKIVSYTGEVRNLHVIEELIYDKHGTLIRSRGATQDITELKRAEEEARKLNSELEQRVEERAAELRAAQADLLRQERMATLGHLTATVSHELRNPLGVIRTSAFIIHDGLKEPTPRVQRALERIERNIIRCDRIINELLDFTRVSEIQAVPTAIDGWLDETLNEQTIPSGVALRCKFGIPDISVLFDRDRFYRAIINVFDNACQAMIGEESENTGSEKHTLTVKTRRHDGRVEVIFEDTGPGISPDIHEKIFEPLYSTKGFGVGLGLTVVKQIMEQHEGGIEIESEVGRGTRVCLWLPHGDAAD